MKKCIPILWQLKNFFVISITIACISFALDKASATDADVTIYMQTRAVISLNALIYMNFPTIEFSPTNSGQIRLGTDNSVDFSGAIGAQNGSEGAPSAAVVQVSGDGASIVDISCETGATLSDGGGHTLVLIDSELMVDSSGPPGAGAACAGLGVASATADLSSSATPLIAVAGTIDLDASPITVGSFFATNIVGGDPLTVRVTYQ